MRTLIAIENDLPTIEDKLALMYSDLVQKAKTHLNVDMTKHIKASLFLEAIKREIACDQDLTLLNYYLNQLNAYLINCRDVTYTVVESLSPVCDYNRKKYSFWIPGDIECIQTAISVNAGVDSSIRLPITTKVLTGSVSSTDAITSILWEQVSGPSTATLTDEDEEEVTLSDLEEGIYVFRLTGETAEDTASDSVTLTVLPALPTVSWDFFVADPTDGVEEETLDYSALIPANSTSFDLNFTSGATSRYLVVKEPVAEPVKTAWYNTALNNGTVPDSVFKAPVTIGSFRYYVSRIPVVLDSSIYVITFSS
jgi:hypothetical protein